MSEQVKHVFIDGIDEGDIIEVARKFGKSISWVFTRLEHKVYNGQVWEKKIVETKPVVNVSNKREPLMRSPITMGISTNW